MDAELVLAAGGRSDYRIVVPTDPPLSTSTAAAELQTFLRQISGAKLEIVEESAPPQDKEIVVGNSARLAGLAPGLDLDGLGPEGCVVRTCGSSLIIAGGEPRGTLYGVYGFLQDHLGCRWFTPQISRIPAQARVAVGPIDERRAPPVQYRNYILNGTDDPYWCARNYFNGFNSSCTPELGGKVSHWQYGHSFQALVPAEEHFKDHPEYFDLTSRKKRALDDPVNLCCTNEDVARIATENMIRAIEAGLEAEQKDPANAAPEVYYLAQNDGGSYCTCPSCMELIEKEGSPSAALLHLCNKIAEEAYKRYPDKSMMTIAYRFSRRPPKMMKAHPRLIVQLCSIECCQSHSHAVCDCPDGVLFREDMEGWQRAAERIWIWDYVANLWHPFLIGPGLHVVDQNIRYFVEHGVSGIFVQDVGERDFRGLRAHAMAQKLWNPSLDMQQPIDEYMSEVYGAAAEPIREFMRIIREKVDRDNIHVRYKAGACQPYMSADVIEKAEALWKNAEEAVAGEPEVLERVREERMHFLCTKLQHSSREAMLSACRIEGGRYMFDRSPQMQEEVAEYSAWAKKRFGEIPATSTMALESEVITLDNGVIQLDFLPGLAGRMIACRLVATGRNFMHATPPDGGRFCMDDGYFETWLGAREPYEDKHQAVCSWGEVDEGGDAGAAESKAFTRDLGSHYLFEIGGMFEHPMQWERWTRLAKAKPRFLIESQRVNRGIFDENSAIMTGLPLDLGRVEDVVICIAGDSKAQPLAAAAKDRSFSPEEVAGGIVLANRSLGLGLRITPRGEGMKRCFFEIDENTSRITFRIETHPITLVPGGGLRLYQQIEVLTDAECPPAV